MTPPTFSWRSIDSRGPEGFGCGTAHYVEGLVDETVRRLTHEELHVAETLAGEGHMVRSLAERRRSGREADLAVCGGRVEIKSFDPLELRDGRVPSPKAVANKLMNAAGQADAVVLTGYGSGLTAATVRSGILRLARRHPELAPRQVRALGDGFDLSWTKSPVRVAARAQPDLKPGREVGLGR